MNTFVSTIREAAPYIQTYRGTRLLIVLPDALVHPRYHSLFRDIALLRTLKLYPLILLDIRHCLEPIWKIPYTKDTAITAAMLEQTSQICSNLLTRLRHLLVSGLAATQGKSAYAVLQGEWVYARPRGIIAGHDLGSNGVIRRVNTALLHALQEHILLQGPLLPSLSGETLLVDPLELIEHLCREYQPAKMIILTRVPVSWQAQAWDPETARIMVHKNKGIDCELQKWVILLARWCDQNLPRGYLLDPDQDGVLLRELFTAQGNGLLITQEGYETITTATARDVSAICALTAPLQLSGVLRPRNASTIERHIDHFVVARRDFSVIGCAALTPYQPQDDIVELECLVVDPMHHREGIGTRLFIHMENKARKQGYRKLIILTTQSMTWFAEHGFIAADLPITNDYCARRGAKIMIKNL